MTQQIETKPVRRTYLSHVLFTVGTAASVSLVSSMPSQATGVHVSVKANDLHWRADGTDPSSTAGQVLKAGETGRVLIDNDPESLRKLRFVSVGGGDGFLLAHFFENA